MRTEKVLDWIEGGDAPYNLDEGFNEFLIDLDRAGAIGNATRDEWKKFYGEQVIIKFEN